LNKPKYVYEFEEDLLIFEFVSVGIKGHIRKMITYSYTGIENVYNLGFGDWNEETNEIDDLSVTNNGDSEKVLSTVASTIFDFTEKYPTAMIVATGSTAARTRLYRIGISNNLQEIQINFSVFGFTEQENWEEFVVGKNYEAFLITKK
jgi:hypothetical protein